MASSDSRSPDQIEADLAAIRNRLTGSIEGLIDQVHPNRVKQRTTLRIKAAIDEQIRAAKAQVIDEQGNLRTDRLAIIGGGVAGLVAFVAILRKIANRGESDGGASEPNTGRAKAKKSGRRQRNRAAKVARKARKARRSDTGGVLDGQSAPVAGVYTAKGRAARKNR